MIVPSHRMLDIKWKHNFIVTYFLFVFVTYIKGNWPFLSSWHLVTISEVEFTVHLCTDSLHSSKEVLVTSAAPDPSRGSRCGHEEKSAKIFSSPGHCALHKCYLAAHFFSYSLDRLKHFSSPRCSSDVSSSTPSDWVVLKEAHGWFI